MKDSGENQKEILALLAKCKDMARGSISSVCGRCNRANCICDRKGARRAYRLTYKDGNQTTQIVYIPKARLSEIRRRLANYAQARKLIEQLIEVNIRIFKNGR